MRNPFQKLLCACGYHVWGPWFKATKRYIYKGTQYGTFFEYTQTCDACATTLTRREIL